MLDLTLNDDPQWDPLCVWVIFSHVVSCSMADTFLKRKKEQARGQRKKEKAALRLERKDEKARRGPSAPGEDPDIAGIKPGPQPPIDW